MDGLRVLTSAPTGSPVFLEAGGLPDPATGGMTGASVEYPMDGCVQAASAGGPAPNQADRSFVSEYVNPANTDQILYTVPNISTTLAAAVTASGAVVSATLTSAVGVVPGMYLTIDTAPNQEVVKVLSVNQSTGVITGYFTRLHVSAVAVTCKRTFYMTDFVVTTSSGTAHKAMLKCRTTISSGSITTGSHAVTFTNQNLSPQIGDLFYVGATVYMEDPSSTSYEAVVVTAISRNPNGTLSGFTANFTQTHAANAVVAFALALSWVNSTKGLEVIGQESQPIAPPGSTIAICFGAAVTGDVLVNVAGFEQ